MKQIWARIIDEEMNSGVIGSPYFSVSRIAYFAGGMIYENSLFIFSGQSGWVFITLPQDLSAEIRYHSGHYKEVWGHLPALARTGEVQIVISPDIEEQNYAALKLFN